MRPVPHETQARRANADYLRHLVFGVFVGCGLGPFGAGWGQSTGIVLGVGRWMSGFGWPGGMSTGVFGMSFHVVRWLPRHPDSRSSEPPS
jgi:hypothetical protein